MSTPSIESTLKSASGALGQIGFVDFTTDLVRNVFEIIVESSMDQLKSYAEFVKTVSQDLSTYQNSLGLVDSNELKKNCEKYAIDVLGLLADVPTAEPKYIYNGNSLDDAKGKRNAIIADLNGFDYDSAASVGTVQDVLSTEPTTSVFEIAGASKSNLDLVIAKKLKIAAENDYNLLITILKIGMQKIVVDRGLIATKLTFHVDASETADFSSTDIQIKSKSFGLTGGISGGGKKFGGRLSGGYSSSKLSVSVVNEKSSAVANMSADVVGEVRIEFRTDSFPSINI